MISLGISFSALILLIYIFHPFLTWKLYLEPAYASEHITLPIPKARMVTESNASVITDLIASVERDTTNAATWFPGVQAQKKIMTPFYALSIPSLGITNAVVATGDTNLSAHLVQYGTSTVPPEKGTTVIFGHSTLPQWFKPQDYNTIFAKLYTIKKDDTILITVASKEYTYKVKKISVVRPDMLSVFEQLDDTSHVTLVTCTPPGTTWKRLVIETELESHDGK